MCKLNLDAQEKAAELGIAHPYKWDQPHYFIATAASPAISDFIKNQPILTNYIDELNSEPLKIQMECEAELQQVSK